MIEYIESLISREEAFLAKFAPGTSQYSLLKNRISALNTVRDIITEERMPSRDEVLFALPRIESIVGKLKKARDKYQADSRNYLRFDPDVRIMERARDIILKTMEDMK